MVESPGKTQDTQLKFNFRSTRNHILVSECSMQHLGYTYTKKKFIVDVKFKFNWVFGIFIC